jgi:HPr kinase/phosphorylase
MLLVHGTTIDLAGNGVLIRGPSGSGKSDLALRLIDGGAILVADDQTGLFVLDGTLMASVPPTIAGLLEVRGMGIMRVPHRERAPLVLVIDLNTAEGIERLPDPEHVHFLGLAVPLLRLSPFEASSSAKVRLAVHSLTRDSAPP